MMYKQTVMFLRMLTAVLLALLSLRSIAQKASSASGTSASGQPVLIRIGTNDNLLLLGVDTNRQLQQLYYGLGSANDTPAANVIASSPPAYPTYGKAYSEVALRLTHSDGNMTTDLVYDRHTSQRIDDNTDLTTIRLHDSYYPVTVSLFYKTYKKENIIAQWVQVDNGEDGPVTLNDFASAGLSFLSSSYYLTSYYGDWAREFNMTETQLQPGIRIIDSKLGVRADQRGNPSFLLSLDRRLHEDDGQVMGATLAWPGNYQLKFEVNSDHRLSVICGMNPAASAYTLDAHHSLTTPSLLHTWSSTGAGTVTQRFHRWARTYGIRDGYGSRDVLLNNWEATYFNFDEPKLTTIIKEAGAMGFDLFLLDDGWFGNKYPRNNDDAGLGDWEVNIKKLPHGIPYLVDQCRQNHLKFGIWIEPEMVNPKSELFERHPDWVITAPHRALDLLRNQLILDLSNPKVQDYVYQSIWKLLSENPGISYVKWDCNRYITNPGSSWLGKDRQSNLFIDYPAALLSLINKVRTAFPKVTLMVCSGGGGRLDYATMPYFQEYWTSDNTDAVDRIRIGWGLGYFFPSVGYASHVSNVPNGITGRTTSLKFRFDVAMTGKLGMDLQPMQMTPAEKTFSKNAIQTYKSISDIVLHGDLYRLLSPFEGDRAALMYAAEDSSKAVVFSYLLHKNIDQNPDRSVLRLKGLKKDARYLLTELNRGEKSRLGDWEGRTFTGEFLMTVGVQFSMSDEYESAVFKLTSLPVPSPPDTAIFTGQQVSVILHHSSGKVDYHFSSGITLNNTVAYVNDVRTGYDCSADYPQHSWHTDNLHDSLGSGIRIHLTHTGKKGAPDLEQLITLYKNRPFLLITLQASSPLSVETRDISPLAILPQQGGALSIPGDEPRILDVPFDNDDWVNDVERSWPSGNEPVVSGISYELSAIYDNAGSGRDNTGSAGIVMGSLTHDFWKTGIRYRAATTLGLLDSLLIFGGAATADNASLPADYGGKDGTHDLALHGTQRGTTVRAPLIYLCAPRDVRTAFVGYGEMNALLNGRLSWKGYAPVYWNSFGVEDVLGMRKIMMPAGVKEISDFLYTLGPFNRYASPVLSIDSYDQGLYTTAVLDSISLYGAQHNQQMGFYFIPFAEWTWKNSISDGLLQGTRTPLRDVVLRDSSGQPIQYKTGDFGAYALDPTHPAVREAIIATLEKAKAIHARFLKIDFLTAGALESTSRYDTAVRSGMQAYSRGMKMLKHLIDSILGPDIFITQAISPLFPNQYAHTRFISTDVYSHLRNDEKGFPDWGSTEASLAIGSHMWWQQGTLWPYTNLDVIVMQHFQHNPDLREQEVRVRLYAMMVMGSLLGDGSDFRQPLACQRARTFLDNPLVCAWFSHPQAFTPIKWADGRNMDQQMIFYRKSDTAMLAQLNFSDNATFTHTFFLRDLGLTPGKYDLVDFLSDKLLQTIIPGQTSFSLSVPEDDAVMVRFVPR